MDLRGTWIDLSQVLDSHSPRTEVALWHSPETGWQTNAQSVHATTHSGTHVDAPFHFGYPTRISDLPLEAFVGRGVTIPVNRLGGEAITADDLARAPVEIRPGDIVLVATGWAEKFGTPAYAIHPYFSPEAARWLVERGIKMVGFDLPSCDPSGPMVAGESTKQGSGVEFPAHHQFLGNGVLIGENFANLTETIGKEVFVFAFPLKIGTGDAGFARVAAFVPALTGES